MPRKPRGQKSAEYRIDGSFDIETDGWDRFVVGGIYTPKHGFQYVWGDENAYYRLINSESNRDLWGWNSGCFDGIWYVGHADNIGEASTIEFTMTGSRAVIIKHKASNTRLLDAMGFCPTSLDKAATGLLKTPKMVLSFPYEDIKIGMPAAKRAELLEYLRIDLENTYHVVRALREYWESQGWDFAITLGSSAWKTAQRLCNLPKAEWRTVADYKFAAEAFKGGRVTLCRRYSDHGYSYDRNSAYPSIMSSTPIPMGPYKDVAGKAASLTLGSSSEGVYQANVTVPETFLNPLPLRLKDKKVYYPHGTFTGVWTGLELRYAELHGVKVNKIYRALVWEPEHCRVWFKDLMTLMFNQRLELGKESFLGKLVKQWACSVYGKTGQRPDRHGIIYNPDDIVICPGYQCPGPPCDTTRCCKHRCRKFCDAYQNLGTSKRFFRFPVFRLSNCAHIESAAYVTAGQRCALHEAASDAGDRLVYSDTDSVRRETEWISALLGKELGQWSPECDYYTDFRGEALKLYRMYMHGKPQKDGSKADEWVVRSKGLPISDPKTFDTYVGNPSIHPKFHAVYDKGVDGLRTALRDGKDGREIFRRKYLARTHHEQIYTGDRIWKGDISYPLSYKEALIRAKDEA